MTQPGQEQQPPAGAPGGWQQPPIPPQGWGQQPPMRPQGWGQQPPMPPQGWGQQPPMPPQGWGQQPTPVDKGFSFGDFINFRYMITPGIITVVYVLAVIGITVAALATLNNSAVGAVIIWVLGMLYVRVIFELMMTRRR